MPEPCEGELEDIEDILGEGDEVGGRPPRPHLVPRARRRGAHATQREEVLADSMIPGTHSVYVRTWGCSHNSSDAEYMAGQLAAYGYRITDDPSEADLWLLNSCTVKGPAEDHFRNAVQKALADGHKVVVSGCVPQAQPRLGYIKGLSVVGVQQIDRVVEVVEETLKGHTVRLFGQKKENGKRLGGAPLDLPKIRKNPLIEIISINTGCLNACTYCKTKHARGELASYPVEQLVERAQQSFQEGVRELWLTSEDTGAYGRDLGTDLPTLLWRLVDTVPDGAMMRLGMTNPPYILEHLEEMARVLSHPRVYAFLHVPVQSGSDAVLSAMRREYSAEDFRHVVRFLRERVPGITVATDIICGFPGETEEDFAETVRLVEEFRFPSLFINQFYPRPGTPAARMPPVPAYEKKQRTKELSQLFRSYNTYGHKVGERQLVLVTEESFDGQFYVAHNKCYDQVLVPRDPALMGRMVEVDIVEAGKHFLKGRPVEPTTTPPPGDAASPLALPLPRGAVSGLLLQREPSSCQAGGRCGGGERAGGGCPGPPTAGDPPPGASLRARVAPAVRAVGLALALAVGAAAALVEIRRAASWALAPSPHGDSAG
ncbi:threonylcarbamoyladenosine tRNA methylthiotransferase isoform X2 [Petromyzon marinus]|uniref:tRNA-t(6)A37 methylthiotransferase n=1 Tax=Petromyzon marinus TaxID=7757 RepID=A0AAJ7T0I6_PETMA|nr:threonylcarbamoyladenosine tRNA methylthiotransferase isoform X2 [Petromyzon marinus]